jgi:hypothetical protein
MSWLFSRALVEAYSEANSSAGQPSVPSSASPTPQAYSSRDKMKAFSRLSRFGMTFAPLTADRGADVLMWFLAGFPVRTSAQPEKAKASPEREADFGVRWHESFARWDRDSRSWKTPQCSLLEGLDVFSGTWPRWGMMQGGACSGQSTPEHLTSESESGLWPTPLANSGTGAGHGPNKKGGPNLQTYVAMWPTPTAHISKEAAYPAEFTRKTPTLTSVAHGGISTQPMPLNPMWVEWLMGWPLGWTDCAASATDRFRQWLLAHGKY